MTEVKVEKKRIKKLQHPFNKFKINKPNFTILTPVSAATFPSV